MATFIRDSRSRLPTRESGNPDVGSGNEERYVGVHTSKTDLQPELEERERLIASELAVAENSTDIILASRLKLSAIQFSKRDIDLSGLSPEVRADCRALVKKVRTATSFPVIGVENDIDRLRRRELRGLIVEARLMESRRGEDKELGIALRKLVRICKLFHDLHDNLEACCTTFHRLKLAVETAEACDGDFDMDV